MRTRVSATILTVLFLLGVSQLSAQLGTQGSILGVATDTTGAVIPGAEVVVTNVETGQSLTTTTNEVGIFEVLGLNRGIYDVSVTLEGFKTWTMERAELIVGQRLRVSPALEVGDVTEQITVESAGVELIQTEKSSVTGTVEARQITDLPINGRNPAELVNLVPGMRYSGRENTGERGNAVQGAGIPLENTEFLIDGLSANASMNERGITIPNVDTIAEFSVETSSFSAENGRNPIQMIMVIKSGTNDFHGALWEFLRNESLDARNTFANSTPKFVQNQFGATAGGPVVRNRTHFFLSNEYTRRRREDLYNSATIAPGMLQGDFSSLSKTITDPFTGDPFVNNQIPQSMFSGASQFFFNDFLLPNSPNNRFRHVEPRPDDLWEFLARIDHQIKDNHRIYGRWIASNHDLVDPQARPDITNTDKSDQDNIGLHYNWTVNPTTLLNLSMGYLRNINNFDGSHTGSDIGNLTEQAGIRGFQTEGRSEHVGLPSISVTGYTGFASPRDGFHKTWGFDSRATLNLVRGRHTLNIGVHHNNRSTASQHDSCCARGNMRFNSQYTGDGFADYVLGLVQRARRNFPIQSFGMSDSPYTAPFFNDSFKVNRKLTLNLGVRFDYWHAKAALRGNQATFDPRIGKAIAGETPDGQVDLTAQPVATALAEFSKDHWVSATEAGVPHGLFDPKGVISPRLGVAWRPTGNSDLVVRGGYGIFPFGIGNGNRAASAIIGPPYWNFESANFTAASNQSWEDAFPDDPSAFLAPTVVGPAWDIEIQTTHEWNASVQTAMPGSSALTVSYVGNRVNNFWNNAGNFVNVPPPGQYDDLQGSAPFPFFSTGLRVYEGIGHTWYNGLHTKWERRFTDGFLFTLAYALGRHMEQAAREPHAPDSYNRGRNSNDRTHIFAFNTVYEIPIGRGRKLLSDANPVVNAILGGWQTTAIYRFWSGSPLSIGQPGATLGNGRSTRANVSGNAEASNPSTGGWFNKDAFSRPAPFTFGNSALGILDGPGEHVLDFGLMKNFYIREDKFVQFRWEMFNAPNHVNLNNPVTNAGISTTGVISSAKSARQMQFGLKFIY